MTPQRPSAGKGWFCVAVLLSSVVGEARADEGAKGDKPALAARFYAEYPEAVKRLEAAVATLHGKARFRVQRPDRPKRSWAELEFFVSGEKVRFENEVPEEQRKGPRADPTRARAVLLTPELCAHVKDPHTEFAYLEYKGEELTPALIVRRSLMLWQYVKAAYCLDGQPILPKIQNNSWVIKEVKRYGRGGEWVALDCSYHQHDTLPDSSKVTGTGTAVLVLSPGEDWAIRELHLRAKTPASFESSRYVDELVRLPQGGYIPKKIRKLTTPPGGGRVLTTDYELLEVSTEPIPDAQFTLEALGIREAAPKGWRQYWVISLVVGAALLLALAGIKYGFFRRRANGTAAVGGAPR